ncbi:MAG TPA: carbon monoxide dehydrogenase subunit G [Jiangellaceae bacterium]|jgi:carbon monoxide dehydrogenase subunit G|nr:carbon monoxide dehydrogenase subunit G [Jiangellaceae bacterium]
MKVTGSAVLHAPRERVWSALQDPAVLVRTIPGCQQLEQVGPDTYRATVMAGVASIKGTYSGDVRLTDQAEPDSFVLHASGAGAPGTVNADVRVTLADADGGATQLDYDADAVVGGVIGGVGQRMIVGVAKKTAGEFFAAVDDVLTGREERILREPSVATGTAPEVFTAPSRQRAPMSAAEMSSAAITGALIALAGVVLGWLITRRAQGRPR